MSNIWAIDKLAPVVTPVYCGISIQVTYAGDVVTAVFQCLILGNKFQKIKIRKRIFASPMPA